MSINVLAFHLNKSWRSTYHTSTDVDVYHPQSIAITVAHDEPKRTALFEPPVPQAHYAISDNLQHEGGRFTQTAPHRPPPALSKPASSNTVHLLRMTKPPAKTNTS